MFKKLGRKTLPNGLRKEKQVAVRLLDSQIQALEKISEREGVSVSYFVREAVELVIQKYSTQSDRKGEK